jgi:antitoxin MazE
MPVYQDSTMAKIARWGNSLALRIPAVVVEALGLKEGDDIRVRASGPDTLELEQAPTPKELLDRLDKYRHLIPADWKFDRLEANARR